MESSEFYQALSKLPSSYKFGVDEGNNIVGRYRTSSVNPVTALAYKQTGTFYRANKKETLKAGRALGLTTDFTNHVYNATTGVSNRGNTQVVRGKIKSALGV